MIIHPSRPFSSLCFDDFFFFWVFLHICFSLFIQPFSLGPLRQGMQKGAWERGLLWELGATTTVARARCRWSPTRGPRRLVQRRCRSDGGVRPPSVATGQAGKRGTGQLAQPGPARLGRGIVRPALVGSQPQPAPPSLGRVVDPPRSSGSLVVLSFVRRAQVLACLLAGWLAMVVGLGFCNQTLASHRTLSTPELSQLDL